MTVEPLSPTAPRIMRLRDGKINHLVLDGRSACGKTGQWKRPRPRGVQCRLCERAGFALPTRVVYCHGVIALAVKYADRWVCERCEQPVRITG